MTRERRDPLFRTYWEEIVRCQAQMEQHAERLLRRWGIPDPDSTPDAWRLNAHQLPDWRADLAQGNLPELWREWGVKETDEKKRRQFLRELSYASLVGSQQKSPWPWERALVKARRARTLCVSVYRG